MAARALLFLLLVVCLALLPAAVHAARALCPERCECGRAEQHVLCANRGLRTVPGAPPAESARLVRVLVLAGNFIDVLGASDLARYGHLARLDLQFNRIGRVHARAFARLSELQELYLGHNLLSAVPPRALQPLTKLAVLYVNDNVIEELEREAFGNLSSVVRLRLDGNALETLRESVFEPLSGLVALQLESNRLRHVHPTAFTSLTRLQFLNLSDNRQTELRDARTFAHLKSLTTLLLARNRIVHVGARIFQDLRRLSTLSLSGNRIIRLEPEALVGLSRLRELALDGNALTEVPAGLLDPLARLESLDLSANQIALVHEAAFTHLARLRVLTLRDNRLARLAGGVLAANSALRALDLRGNEWMCGCRAEALRSRAGGGGELAVRCREREEDEEEEEGKGGAERAEGMEQRGSCADEAQEERLKGGEEGEGVRVAEERAERRKKNMSTSLGDGKKRGKPRALTGALTTKTVPMTTKDAAVAQQRVDSSLQEKCYEHTAALTDACHFNRHHIANVTVDAVTDSTATVHWTAAADRGELALHFRVFFDRLGSSERFPRYAYDDGSSRALTLQELRPDSAYLACVESVVGGVSCHVASREHCAGFVTGAGVREAEAWHVAAAALALSVFLALLLGGAGLARALTRRRRSCRIKGGRAYSYSARTPFRAAMATACASSEFSAYRSGRALAEEGDLIQFTGDRLYNSAPGCREDGVTMQRFID
ncbi:TLR4 interactor with leucine rich repeats [Pygocentrus nattereri]|uniref:Fibronectin type-III domain-containing protein n=1 Tax=Pygocentrus nattereri TaxID=42514 RepID=A0A3B4BRZ0_PYGNA|nr:TLR4 interactor with leucine rich repeats [Pygocentrus nattereri]